MNFSSNFNKDKEVFILTLTGGELDNKEIILIVLTGGPCAGKSTALARIVQEFTSRGVKVIIKKETFTAMYECGIELDDFENVEFQRMLLALADAEERTCIEAAKLHKADRILIVCDRGLPDGLAYLNKVDQKKLLDIYSTTLFNLKNRYDGVIHMVTAADGAEEAFLANKSNNPSRKEDIPDAIAADRALQKVWTGHPRLCVVGNDCDFSQKVTRVLQAIAGIMGIPEPLEIERKYLIQMPDFTELSKHVKLVKLNIYQTYLADNGTDSERRVRMFSEGDETSYRFFYTEKRFVSPGKRVEVEREISQREYNELLLHAASEKCSIRKTRYCFIHGTHYFELDVYPFWKDRAILEVELISEDAHVNIPDFIHVLEDVTDKKEYSNYSLASSVPE